jgi:hypothetical protein
MNKLLKKTQNLLDMHSQKFMGMIFAVILFAGICVFRDYGISWDERIERNSTFINLNYVAQVFGLSLPSEAEKIQSLKT